MTNVYFVADTHFGHKNIFKHTKRKFSETQDLVEHDEKLIEIWNKKIKKNDIVYIVGDFSFHSAEKTKELLKRLNGQKHLILGNHDTSSSRIQEMFVTVSHIKFVSFKKDNYHFMDDNMEIVLCHYPIASWPNKQRGAINVHGHCHGKYDKINRIDKELRVDVGIDSELGNNDIVSLEQLYHACKKITNGLRFGEYYEKIYCKQNFLTKIISIFKENLLTLSHKF